jgi:hypothetical protein
MITLRAEEPHPEEQEIQLVKNLRNRLLIVQDKTSFLPLLNALIELMIIRISGVVDLPRVSIRRLWKGPKLIVLQHLKENKKQSARHRGRLATTTPASKMRVRIGAVHPKKKALNEAAAPE